MSRYRFYAMLKTAEKWKKWSVWHPSLSTRSGNLSGRGSVSAAKLPEQPLVQEEQPLFQNKSRPQWCRLNVKCPPFKRLTGVTILLQAPSQNERHVPPSGGPGLRFIWSRSAAERVGRRDAGWAACCAAANTCASLGSALWRIINQLRHGFRKKWLNGIQAGTNYDT